MKNMKKLAALLLALLLVLTMTAAYADETVTGSITINGISGSASSRYDLYKLLDLESYNVEEGAYSYKVNAAWTGYFATEGAKKYFTTNDGGYITWIEGVPESAAVTFAKEALAYAKANGINPVKSSATVGDMVITEGETKSGKFSNLEFGYYLIDSNVGVLCGLTTTNPNASVNAKNGTPTLDKQVKEDSTGHFGGENTADIGQTVEFQTTINVHAGAQNYLLHDKMEDGLTFKSVTKVERIIPNVSTTELGTADYTVVTTGLTDDCDFHVVFSETFCNKLETNDKIVVYYEAMLNRNAVIAGNGNVNETYLEFGENYSHSTTHDKTTTKTYGFEIVKTDKQNTLIDVAVFRIYDAETGGNEVAVVPLRTDDDDPNTAIKDNNGNPIYRRARTDEEGVDIPVVDGLVRIVGFDNGTYYLEEIEAPEGYNELTARQKFIIADDNKYSIFNDDIYSSGSGVHVVNGTGAMLPETGGIGTTLFYVIGGVLAVAAVVLLVTKKRMNGMD